MKTIHAGREVRIGTKVFTKLVGERVFLDMENINLTLCVPCIILQCVNDQRDAQFL